MITKTDIEKYFLAEKQESLIFLIIGITAIVIAALGIFLWKTQAWKGAAIPLIIIAFIQITVGYTVYKRSDKDRVRVVYALDMNPDELKSNELPRMDVVNKNFIIYRYVEITLLIAGIVLAFYCRDNNEKQMWMGLGIALAIQAFVMLGADFFAEKRALRYTQQLKESVK